MKGAYSRLIFVTVLLGMMAAVFYGCEGDNESPATYQFTILQTTDMHNHVSGYGVHADYSPLTVNDDDVLGGYARIGAKIQEIRSEQEKNNIPVVVVDSGDFLMGTVYDFASTSSPPSLWFMQMAHYDAITLGNHEFDYSAVGLAQILNAAKSFSKTVAAINETAEVPLVPIVATNMVTDGEDGTADDGLEALEDDGTIVKSLCLDLFNGLKIGIIGLMGEEADEYAPMAGVDFDHTVADIQEAVDDLRNNQGAQVVIALSHSGITDPGGTPKGDDISLADNVTGIDIIASGHEHETTQTLVTENGTYIFCAGSYGTNLARLDVTYRAATAAIDTPTLTNIAIDDSFKGSKWMQDALDMVDAGLDAEIQKLDPSLSLAGTIGVSMTDNVGQPYDAAESGLGNLVADAVRYTLRTPVTYGLITTPTVGMVAQGVVRGGFDYGQYISLADLYAVLPLGITSATDQTVPLPGYPLMQVYLTGAEIQTLCQINAYVMASQDSTFMSGLAASESEQLQALYLGLSGLSSDYYMNLSGVQFTHGGTAGYYTVAGVKMYEPDDYQCLGTPSDIVSVQYYPCVVDLYALSMLLSDDMQALLSNLQFSIEPKYLDTTTMSFAAVTAANVLSTRIDSDPYTEGVQELKEWMALLNYLTSSTDVDGLGSMILDAQYGTSTLGRVQTAQQ